MIFKNDWFSHNEKHLKVFLKDYIGKKSNFLEIGCNEGRSTIWFLQNILTHEDSRITVMDTFNHSYSYKKSNAKVTELEKVFKDNIKELGEDIAKKVFVYKGNSQYILRNIPPIPRFDVIYVDGDHKASSVLEDMVCSFTLLKPNGLMILDDYMWGYNGEKWYGSAKDYNKPRIAIDSFIKVYEPHIEVIYKEYQLIIKKKGKQKLL